MQLLEQPYSAIIFDCDGTLVDSMPAHYEAWTRTLNRHGMELDEDEFYALGGWPTYHVAKHVIDRVGSNVDPAVITREKESDFEKYLHLVQPIEATIQVARENFGKVPMAVATGAMRYICEQLLSNAGIRSLFQAVVTCDDVPRHKPEPDIYLEAARLIEVQPVECLVFEDTNPGVAAGHAAGMRVIDVRSYYQPRRISA